MSTRISLSFLGLCVVTAAAALLSPASAQQRIAARTADGHPNLQGNWSNATITPFQRAEGQGPLFSTSEVARLEGRAEETVRAGAAPSDPNRAPPKVGGSIGSYNDVWFERGKRVAVINGEFRSSLLTNPPDGRRPPLTEAGRRQQQEQRDFRSQFGSADNPENRSLTDRCLMFASNVGPPMIPNSAYNNNYTIVQTADYVLIHAEVVHDARIIRLGTPNRLPTDVTPWMGDSWGRWEGDALVVETTNISPLHTFRGISPSKSLKVTERFTRVDDNTLLYEFRIDDPTTYTQPWGGEIPLNRFADQLYEYACHEGNYALGNILSGARYEERQAGRNQPEQR